MALIPTHTVTAAGTAPTFGAAAAADTAETGGRTYLVCRNTNVASRTVTIAGQATLPSGVAFPDRVYTLAADTGELWIPLIAQYRNVDGVAEITWSATEGVTRAVVKL
ncbi:hypothetical protein [Nocardiopsis sp. NPDC057823]|uniref:hypothetical protein n=1 Tax=Nocardiopsis sp. NPDC057823 TaxID=3346256 RepID=UPI00367291FE